MNLFQYLALPVTGGLLIWNLFRLITGKPSRAIAFLGSLIWLIASIAILSPELTMQIAGFLGIGRGADLVLYILVISFLIFVFYTYQQFQKLESHLTEIVRQMALQNPGKSAWNENKPGEQPNSSEDRG